MTRVSSGTTPLSRMSSQLGGRPAPQQPQPSAAPHGGYGAGGAWGAVLSGARFA